jgi:integrase
VTDAVAASIPLPRGRRGHGEGSIFRRDDGLWVAVVDLGRVNGRRRRKALYGKTRREVQQKLVPAQRARQQGLPQTSERQTVAMFLKEWLGTVRLELRATTFRRYEENVRIHAIPALGALSLAQLSPQHLRTLYADRIAAGLAPASVGHLHAVLHKALRQAERDGIIPRNVAALVTPPRSPHKTMQTLSPEQVRTLLDATLGDRLEALYVLATTSGMRQGELLALRWRDLDLDARTISVQATLQWTPDGYALAEPKTARSRRQIVLAEVAIAALRRHRIRQLEERMAVGATWRDLDLVFTNEIGGPMDAPNLLRRRFYPLLKRAGLPRIRFHDLRHTAATLMLGLGEHPKVVSEMLGHSQIAVTLDLYSHVTPTMQRGAVRALDGLLAASVPV